METRKRSLAVLLVVLLGCILSGCEITGASPDPDVEIMASPGESLTFQVYGPIPRTEGSLLSGLPTMATYRWSADAPGSWVYQNVRTDSRTYTYTIPKDAHASKIKITCQLLEITWPITTNMAMRIADSRTWTIRVNLGTPPVWNGDYVIEDITDLNVLKDYTSVAGVLNIMNTSFSNLVGLENITRVGQLKINANSRMTSLSGLDGLTDVTGFSNSDGSYEPGGIYISANPVLNDLTALSKVTQVKNVWVSSNDMLATLDGLEGLTDASGWIYLRENKMLKDIKAFRNITRMGQLYIYDNPALTDLEGLEGLTAVTDEIYITNTYLTSLAALRNVTTVGCLHISDNSELSLLGMDALARVEKYISIYNNEALCTSSAQALWDQVVGRDGIGDLSFSYIRNNLECTTP